MSCILSGSSSYEAVMRCLFHVVVEVSNDWTVVLSAASAVFPYDDGGLRERSSPGRSNIDVEERTGGLWGSALE